MQHEKNMQHYIQVHADWWLCLTFSPPHPVKIVQEDFPGPSSDLLLYYCLFAYSSPANIWVLNQAFSSIGNKLEFIWKGWCVQVWIWREESPAWSFLVCQQADSISLSKNILAFLQRTPISMLLVGSEKSKRCTSEKYQRGGTHRLALTGCIAN